MYYKSTYRFPFGTPRVPFQYPFKSFMVRGVG